MTLEMWYPDTWISRYLDIQILGYPSKFGYPLSADTKKVEISKYPYHDEIKKGFNMNRNRITNQWSAEYAKNPCHYVISRLF